MNTVFPERARPVTPSRTTGSNAPETEAPVRSNRRGSCRRLGDRVQRNLGCPVGKQQPVGFLVGVGKLGVAEPAHQRQVADDGEQPLVAARELFR